MFRLSGWDIFLPAFKQLDDSLKPRERIKRSEVNSLSDAELLAIVIGSGTKSSDVLAVAHKILLTFNGLNRMQTCSISDFEEIHGIGEAKAITLYTIFEICKRANNEKFYIDKISLTTPDVIYELCRPMVDLQQEKLVVICVNRQQELISKTEVFVGEISSVMMQPREIFRTVFNKNAYAFILVHNHPSGNFEPSQADLDSTASIISGARFLNVLFMDHVIVASAGFYSIRANHLELFQR